jgi:hypothetical protein
MTQLTEQYYDDGSFQGNKEANPPKPLFVGDRLGVPGQPTTHPMSRGYIDKGGMSYTNFSVFHICDPKSTLAYDFAYINGLIRTAMQEVRAAIESAMQGEDSESSLGTQLREAIKWITGKLKLLNRILKTIDNTIKAANRLVGELNKLIAWIKALPAAIALALAKCLKLLENALEGALSAAIGGLTSGGGPNLGIGELLRTAKQTIGTAASIGKDAALLNSNVNLLKAQFSGKAPTPKVFGKML